ncbi:MAG: riboflavin biosynthesis protein RibF, partial [Chitinivibrionia bacterium]|nr:riboflavin biosynthesis protein RibF [Chitinivibrionia bacterium]
MRIAHSLEELMPLGLKNTAVSIGVFDGVHAGHAKIIKELIRCRDERGADGAYVITFSPHPLTVTHSRISPPILSTIDERIELLSGFPLDGILVVTFDSALADLDYRTFLNRYVLNGLNMKHLVIGYDFHFGRNREGSPERLMEDSKKGNFSLKIVPPACIHDVVISSTQIRNQLIEGNLERAVQLLGHPYLVRGRVVAGRGEGRSIGFPTANLAVSNPYKLWPSNGVYAVRVRVDDAMHAGMMNVGTAPTMKGATLGTREMEVHIFDFSGDLYDKIISVYCCRYMRAERMFGGPSELA